MKIWIGSRLGQNQPETYTDEIRNIPIRITHNLNISEYRQIFSVRFRDINSGREVLTGASHFFDGDTGPKFYITSFSPNEFVIELRPNLEDGMCEYLIELVEEEDDPSITVSTGGSVDSLGFDLNYRFDFGDGTVTDWSPSNDSSHIYETAGTYRIRSQASALSLSSYWSDPLTVRVYDESLIVPAPPVLEGDIEVQLGLMSSYQVSGDPIFDGTTEYRVDWSDGDVSEWTQYNSFSHTWKEEGTYNITSQARPVTGYRKLSSWSDPLEVKVDSQFFLIQELESSRFIIDNTIRKTSIPVLDQLIVRGTTLRVTVPIPSLLYGESAEYKLNFGNGTVTNFQSSNVFYNTYVHEGTYKLTACLRKKILVDSTYQWIEFEWSDSVTVQVKERIVSTPTAPVSINGVSEILCKRKGETTTNPSGETFIIRSGKKWISDFTACPGLGKYFVNHGLDEYPYLIYIDFDLEGDQQIRFGEKRYSLKTDESLFYTSAAIKQQTGGKIPTIFHQYIESIVLDNLGTEQKVIASRYKILVRA